MGTLSLDDLAAVFVNTQAGPLRREIAAGGLERDLVVYFYEQFLQQYDKGERQSRGVYYTAPELVGYVTRGTQDLLRRVFNIPDGLADSRVIVLDPAAGTGTFLLGAAEEALSLAAGRGTAAQRQLIREHLLPHFFGLELLPAPYVIAHLKLHSFYAQFGHHLEANERIAIYLSNTLTPSDDSAPQFVFAPMLQGIVNEGREASRVKTQVPVLVVMGNPPYERTSHNANPHSDDLLQDFYHIDGVRIPDRNTGPLRDDYLRFIRWSIWKLLEQEGSPGHGILAFVTNRAFIERPLHRAVRRSLMRRFDEVWILDLHGDQREWYRDRTDEKVFPDVQAGIAITILVKGASSHNGPATIKYREAFGTRQEKLLAVQEANLSDDAWANIDPRDPLWLFVPHNVPPEYDRWPTVADLFPRNVIGVQTHRDQLVVAFTEADLRHRLERFADPEVPDAEWHRSRVRSTADWDLPQARRDLRRQAPRRITRWTYRGLEQRWVAFDERLIDRTRGNHSKQLFGRDNNLALAFANGSLTDGPYALVSRRPVPAAVLSWRTLGQAYFAPLWVHHSVSDAWEPNVATGLLERLAANGIEVTPEGLMHYVYAVLNSPEYRRRFADGLRYGFGRIPIARDPDRFNALRELGETLCVVHLLEYPGLQTLRPRLDGDDRCIVDEPVYDEASQSIRIGEALSARPVSVQAWTYQQGAYPLVRNFLADRRGRTLAAEEFDQFALLVAAAELTTDLLPRVDDILGEATEDALSIDELGLSD